MAFILKNTKLLNSLVGMVCPSGRLANRSQKIFFIERPCIFNFKDFQIRSKVSLAQKESEQEIDVNSSFDRTFYQLNQDVRRKNVSIKDMQSVLSGAQKKGEITNFEFMTLLKCCTQIAIMPSEKERVEMAEKIWKTAENLGVQFSVTHYNALLDVFLDNNHAFSPSEFLSNLEKANITPNIHTYRRLLKAYCQQGDLKGASNTLNKMKEMDYKLNEIDFNALILGYCNTGDLDKAEEIIKVMESKNVEPSAQTYVNILCGYAKHGLIEKLIDTLKELPSKEVFLADEDVMEVLYALAVNNYGDKVNVVLQEFSSLEMDEFLSKFIHRLFHKNLDSVALSLLSDIEINNSAQFPASVSQHIVDHFISYRTPGEIVKMCDWLEKKKMAKVPLAYALKTVFQNKDEEFSLKFFNALKAEKLEVRKHYYWPGIIKASKKGNSYFLAHLKKLPKNVLINWKTARGFVFPNYSFGEDWQTDLKLLNEIGFQTAFTTRYIAEKLLLKDRFDDFLQLVSSQPVFAYRTNHIFNILGSFLKTSPEKTEQVVDVIYKLSHDFYHFKKNFSTAINFPNFFDGALRFLLKQELEENTVIELLENMLKKKLRISDSVAAHVKNLNYSQRVEELVRKLTDPDLTFEVDQNLLSLKSFDDLSAPKQHLSQFQTNGLLMSTLSELFDVITADKFDEALKICEQLYFQKRELKIKRNLEWKFRKCYLLSAQKGNPKLTEKLFEVGVSLGLLKSNDFVPVVRSMLVSKNFTEAIDRYCEFVLHHGSLSGCLEVLSELVSQENVEGCQKIVDLVTDIRSKNTGLSVLVCAFMRTKNFEKARKVLETPGFTFSNKVGHSFCIYESKKENSEFFENIFEIIESLNYFQGNWIFKVLAEKYLEEKNVDKLVELWPKIPKNLIDSDNFFRQYESFVENPSAEQLKVFSDTSKNELGEDNSGTDKTDSNNKNDEEQFKIANEIEAEALAREGKISELVELVKKSRVRIKRIADVFFQEEKVENYFKFIQLLLSEKEVTKISNILYTHQLLPHLMKDDYFIKYNALAVECLKNNVIKPFIFCLINCLLQGKVQDVKRMLEENSSLFNLNTIKLGTILQVLKEAKISRVKLAEAIFSDDELRGKFSSHLPNLYGFVLLKKSAEDDTKSLVHYLNLAKSDGCLNLINTPSIRRVVKEKLEKHNISFPLENWD